MTISFGIVGVGVVAVVEFHDVKSAAVDVEMDIPCLKIRRDRFPYPDIGIELFDLAPRRIAYALAVNAGRHEQYFKIAAFALGVYDNTADLFITEHYPVGCAAVNALLNGAAGYNIFTFFKVIVTSAELFQSAVIESFLIILYELLSVARFKRQKMYLRFCVHCIAPLHKHLELQRMYARQFTSYCFIIHPAV